MTGVERVINMSGEFHINDALV